MRNEVCTWLEKSDSCVSLFGPCANFGDEVQCSAASQFNINCLWDEDPFHEGIFGCQDTSTTAPPIIECNTITDQHTCQNSNATYTNMPCIWNTLSHECSEFTFDCESFLTQHLCEHSSFGNIQCIWIEDECDEREPGGILRGIHITKTLSKNTVVFWFMLMFVFGFGLTCGAVTIYNKLRWKQSPLSEPLPISSDQI
jgi:hypothetical protein